MTALLHKDQNCRVYKDMKTCVRTYMRTRKGELSSNTAAISRASIVENTVSDTPDIGNPLIKQLLMTMVLR